MNRFFFYIFGRNVTDRQWTYYYAISNNLCTTWQNGEKRKSHFSLKCCITALPEFNQLLDFFNLFDSRLIYVMYDSLNLVINAFSLQSCWGHGSVERKSRVLHELDCVACTMHQCAVFWVSYFAR